MDEEQVPKVQEAIIKEEENSRFFISGYFCVSVNKVRRSIPGIAAAVDQAARVTMITLGGNGKVKM